MKTTSPENSLQKPLLVVVSNGITPYGTHFLRRIAEELPEFALRTIYSYEFSMGHWQIPLPPSINAKIVGKGEDAPGLFGITAFWRGWIRYRQLVREIRASKPAALMIGYGHIAHLLLIEWCSRNGIPCLTMGDSNIRGDRHRGLKAWIKKLMVSRVVSRCRAILPCGTLGSQYFQRYGAQPEQIFFMPVEPDYSLMENLPPNAVESLAAEFSIDPARRRLLYSGRLAEVKRVDLLIEAFAQVADQRPKWDMMIVGGGPLEEKLKALVPDRLRQRILWTGFVSTPQRMSAFYRLADVLVLPSNYEPWALVVNEAACAGLALICSDVVGAAAELLHDGENGRFFQTDNAASLATALLDATDERNLARYKTASPEILKCWRKNADPVEGLRRALNYCLQPDASPHTAANE